MKIIAFFKVWDGHEWLSASIKSIYNYVDKILLLTSNISWIGQLDNPSIPEINRIKKDEDTENKIIHINHDESNQMKHCNYGYKWLEENHPDCDYYMLMDSDEIFHDNEIKKAKEFLINNPDHKAYRCHVRTFLKSPFYMVWPPEPLCPTIYVKANQKNYGFEPRGCGIKPFIVIENSYYCHYTWVRDHVNSVFIKIIQSHVSEKQPMHDIDTWITTIWNNLPRGKNLHIARGFAHNWLQIKQIPRSELPECIQGGHPVVKKYDRGNIA